MAVYGLEQEVSMTRDEALKQLEGTWAYKVRSGMVLVNDPLLLAEIRRMQDALQSDAPRSRPAPGPDCSRNRPVWSGVRSEPAEQTFN